MASRETRPGSQSRVGEAVFDHAPWTVAGKRSHGRDTTLARRSGRRSEYPATGAFARERRRQETVRLMVDRQRPIQRHQPLDESGGAGGLGDTALGTRRQIIRDAKPSLPAEAGRRARSCSLVRPPEANPVGATDAPTVAPLGARIDTSKGQPLATAPFARSG